MPSTFRTLAAATAVAVGAGVLIAAPPATADLEPGFGARTPAAVRAADDRLTLFATDGADRVWQRTQTAPGAATWSGWTELGGRMRALAAATGADGLITLTGLEKTGQVRQRSQTPAGGWTDWAPLDGTMTSVATARSGDRLELFGADAAGAVWQRTATGWARMEGSARTVAAATNAAGRAELFWTDATGAVAHRWQKPDGRWSAQYRLPGLNATAIAAARNGNGTLEVFAATATGTLWHAWQTAAGSDEWTGWSQFTGSARGLAAVTEADGRLELLGLDGVGRLSHRWQRPGGWSDWTRLAGDLDPAYPDGGRVTKLDGHPFDLVRGWSTTVVTGADGLGLITYYDPVLGDLKVAHCDNIECSSASTRVIESVEDAGLVSAVAIGRDGLPIIAFSRTLSGTWGMLAVAHCNDVRCDSADVRLVPNAGAIVDGPLSIAIGGDGLPVIGVAFHNARANHAFLVHCADLTCGAAVTRYVGRRFSPASDVSLSIGTDGLPVMAFEGQDSIGAVLQLARCLSPACDTFAYSLVDQDPAGAGRNNSLTFGPDGAPLLSYTKGSGLFVAHCPAAGCTISPVDTGTAAGRTAIRFGEDAVATIVYEDRTNHVLQAAHCANVACRTSTKAAFARTGDRADPALTIGADGLPLVSYHDEPAGALAVAHCNNLRCVSFRLPAPFVPTPPAGVQRVDVVNCLEGRPAALWVNDRTAGTGWQRIAEQPTMPPNWGRCGLRAFSGSPWTFRPLDGHVYDLRAVDFTAPGCVDNPEYAACWRLDKRGVVGNPSGLVERDVLNG